MQLTMQNDDGTYDITNMVQSMTLSGDLDSCCRTLEFYTIASPNDPNLPYVFIPVGGVLDLYEQDQHIFHGLVEESPSRPTTQACV